MPPQTGPALILLVAFVLPGFVTVMLQERTFRSAEDPTPLDRLLRAVYYSVWCYLLLALVALLCGIDRSYVESLYNDYKTDPAELVWRGALVILLPPFVIANATRIWHLSRAQQKLLKLARVNERHTQPTAWDHFFRQRRQAYVRVSLKDGGRVFGFYGPRSFAAYAKDGGDLFLERIYVPDDDWFGAQVAGGVGVWVRTDEVVGIEFYDPDYASSTTPGGAPAEAPREETGRTPGAESDQSSGRATSAPAEAEPG